MNKLIRTYLPLMALSICLQAQADCDFDDFPRMDDMLVSSIGENIQWNHAPINARAFRVPNSVTGVKDFYAGEWADAVDFTEFDGWDQILHINEDCMMMVQVKAQNDRFSYGRMTITNPPENGGATLELGSGMPVPPDAEVVSDMRSDDKIRKGRMVLILSHDTMHATRAWYEAELLNQGWKLEQRSQQENATVLNFAKGRELMTVGLLRHAEKTQVLLNRMDR
ncbi:hypothetical protein [Pseudomonas sp. TTU2014-080ASC]|uniref:hypothetical protein n=1 Tax=Pseudomonas sp. TTU2014-080ASC TaxID=1729724 RepID=UPI000B22E359|nr:hypothetical protein [Pseudomonas sp. TTU2014-080ASC]